VLRYRLLREDADGNSIGYTRHDALADAAAAMTYIRTHAGEPQPPAVKPFSVSHAALCILSVILRTECTGQWRQNGFTQRPRPGEYGVDPGKVGVALDVKVILTQSRICHW
jgi:hypothetical protein